MNRRNAYRGLILLALVLGVALGVVLIPEPVPQYAFLRGARPIRVAEYVRGSTRGMLRIYNVHFDWRAILGLAERESPLAVVESGRYHGLLAGTIVVPQMEAGRAKLFETPVREITVIDGKFIRDKSGVEIACPSEAGWAGVRVVEFRPPSRLDLGRWLRERVRV